MAKKTVTILTATMLAASTLLTALPANAETTQNTSATSTTSCSKPHLKDNTVGSSFYSSIRWAHCEGIISGYTDGTFRAQRTVTRNETASMLYRYIDPDWTAPRTSQFKDLSVKNRYHKPVSYFAENRIINGYTNGNWGGSDGMLRHHFAMVLYKSVNPQWTPPAKSKFSDIKAGSGYHTAVSWMDANGIAKGYSNGKFGAANKITRGEMAAMLYRLDSLNGNYKTSSTDDAIKRISTVYNASHTSGPIKGNYHVVAEGIDYSKPVGAVVYFDGDSSRPEYSRVENPHSSRFQDIAREANRRNMVLIAPISPDRETNGGRTWWVEGNTNHVWFHSLATHLMNSNPAIDRTRVWSMGYSGGAEFIAQQAYQKNPETWMRDGGAIIIGGGGVYQFSRDAAPSNTFKKNVKMRWYVGSKDVAGETNPPTWSALQAAKDGAARYKNAGYPDASVNVMNGLGHLDYDIPGILGGELDQNGIKRLR